MAKILRITEVKDRIGLKGSASVYAAVQDGIFPTPVSIGKRATGWPDFEIDALNKARIAGLSDDQIRKLVDQLHAARKVDFETPLGADFATRSARVKELATRRVKSTVIC